MLYFLPGLKVDCIYRQD